MSIGVHLNAKIQHFPSEYCSVERWLIIHSAASGFDVVSDRSMLLYTCASSCLLMLFYTLTCRIVFQPFLLKKVPVGEPAATLCLILPLWQHSWVDLFMIVLDFLSVCQLEEQLSRLQREKNDLQSRMEEDQEDLNELMKKHKAAVAQVGLFHTQTLCVH